MMIAPVAAWSGRIGTRDWAATSSSATAPTEAAWPSVIGSNAVNSTAWLLRWSARKTAKSQPIAGLTPWKAPSSAAGRSGSVMTHDG